MTDDWRKRLLVAVGLFGAAAAPLSRTQPVEVLPNPSGLATVLPLAWLTQPLGHAVAFVLVLVLLGLFVRGRAMPIAGVGMFLLVLALNSVARSMTNADPNGSQGSQVPSVAIAAWSLGRAIARPLKRDPERLGTSLACGIVGSGYVMAALSKLLARGIGWADGPTLALMIYERITGAIAPLAVLRGAVAHTPWLCTAGMAGALVLESCGWLFLFRGTRRAYAAAVVTFHVSSGLLLGFPHFEWAVTAIAWAWAGSSAATPASDRIARRAELNDDV